MLTNVTKVEVIEIFDLLVFREHSHIHADKVLLDIFLLSEVTTLNLHPLVADLFNLRTDLDGLALVEKRLAMRLITWEEGYSLML